MQTGAAEPCQTLQLLQKHGFPGDKVLGARRHRRPQRLGGRWQRGGAAGGGQEAHPGADPCAGALCLAAPPQLVIVLMVRLSAVYTQCQLSARLSHSLTQAVTPIMQKCTQRVTCLLPEQNCSLCSRAARCSTCLWTRAAKPNSTPDCAPASRSPCRNSASCAPWPQVAALLVGTTTWLQALAQARSSTWLQVTAALVVRGAVRRTWRRRCLSGLRSTRSGGRRSMRQTPTCGLGVHCNWVLWIAIHMLRILCV